MPINVTQVNEDSAQLLANETGKIVYMEYAPGGRMTTERKDTEWWGRFQAIAPVLSEKQHDAEMLGANLRVLAQSAEMTGTLGRQDVRRTIQGIDAITDEINKPLKRKLVQCPVCRVISGSNQLVEGRIWCQSCGLWRDRTPEQAEPEPESQLRVVRVLEYRGPRSWIETTLHKSFVHENGPRSGQTGPPHDQAHWEIVEQLRMTTRLCRWCGEDHLDRQSEVECGANPRKGRY
jgi:hypothetical protein